MLEKRITSRRYKILLVNAAQAIEAHAFGEVVQYQDANGNWRTVPTFWKKADLTKKYRTAVEKTSK